MHRLQALIVPRLPVQAVLRVRRRLQGGEAEDGAERRRMHLHLVLWRRLRRVDGEHPRRVNGGRMVVMRMARDILTSEERLVRCYDTEEFGGSVRLLGI